VIFLRRESFKEYVRYYPVTFGILILLFAMFAVLEIVGSSKDPATLIRLGAIYQVEGFEAPEWWRYFSAIFLHIGFEHLLFNAFAIYVFASPLERIMGKLSYAVFFLLSGFAGCAFSLWLTEPPFFSAGASGSIYGVYAAYLFMGLFRRNWLDSQTRQTVVTILIIGFLYSIVVPYVSLYGHLGGFIGGFLLFGLMTQRVRR